MMDGFVQVNDGPRPVGYVVEPNGCWMWTGAKAAGYGIWSGPKSKGLTTTTSAHRVMYERIKGPIPKGLHLDHLCRNKACVNPAHLEPVTTQENTRRAQGTYLRWNQRKKLLQGPCTRWIYRPPHFRERKTPWGVERQELVFLSSGEAPIWI